MSTIKLSPKQKEIVWLMQEGYSLMIGTNDTTGNQYYMIASTHNKGYKDTYFRVDVFSNLLNMGLIYFHNGSFEWILTELGESIVFNKCPIKEPEKLHPPL